MYPQKLICDHGEGVNLLDLPEITFRKIFKKLDDQVVWFTVSHICRKIRYYVENYIQLSNVFLDVYTSSVNKVTKMLYIFKKFDKVQSIYCTTISTNTRHLCFSDFGVVTSEKAVLGKISILKPRNALHGIMHILFERKASQGGFIGELWEINSKQHTWKAFPENHKFNCGRYRIWGFAYEVYSCPIGHSKILLNTSGLPNGLEAFLLIDFKVENENKCKRQLNHDLYVKSIKSIPIQIEDRHRFDGTKVVSMIQISQENILIIGQGGESWDRYRNDFGNPLLLWKGSLRKNKLHLELIKAKDTRNKGVSVCFKIKMSLYIVTGQYCDMFNIEEGEYHEKVFPFPYYEEYPGMHYTAITDANETFAMILLDNHDTNRAIIFTETEGFKDIVMQEYYYYINKNYPTRVNFPCSTSTSITPLIINNNRVGKHILLPIR